ncbi:MAG TPA: tannase/feruloyl esterase family alpha/beta hydrolase, partial [Nevskiaceae bacterium]|nr:tannase/feruloyl esterase family alpha/beta hydrolase [Nevskiaceae bacterium]
AAQPAKLPFGPLPPFLAVVPAAPEYCKAMGQIRPVDPKAPPIRFEVNLPTHWNGSSVQFGGGGFNGMLITGLGLPPLARADEPSPLAMGFVTYGTDSGHQMVPGVPLQAFALNDEALTNFSYAAYKKVRDVAVDLMQRRYGRSAAKLYFVGFSEGGREGLTMAQRFPNDFDGIISGVPVINWVALQTAGTRVGAAQFGKGWIEPEKVKLVGKAVRAACDKLDGLADGIVSDYRGCRKAFDVSALACRTGNTSQCLTPPQIDVVKLIHSPTELGFTVSNGEDSYPGWGVGGEATSGTGPIGGWISWQTGDTPPTLPPGPTNSRAWLYGSGAIQYFFARDPHYDATHFRPEHFAARMKEVSALMDSTDPDLSAFARHGGKLLMYENMADYAQSPYEGIAYFEAVTRRFGQDQARKFARLYVNPGVDHMGGGAPASVSLLPTLTAWVTKGTAPKPMTVALQQATPPYVIQIERPLCEYPAFPRYHSGPEAHASSFTCATH